MKPYLLEAHKGVDSECPENTMPAFVRAADQGYDMIETDTKFTKDNRCVLLHDRTLNRTGRLPSGEPIPKEPEELPIASLTLDEARAYDMGVARGEQFRGTKLSTLEELLAFAKERNIRLKLDNVMQSHSPQQMGILLDLVGQSGAAHLVGFTSNSPDFIRDVILARFPEADVHYDGPVSEAVLAELQSAVGGGHLTVWLRYDNRRTSWNKNAPASDELCAMVKRYAKLGVWILDREEERTEAVERYHADVIETDGSLKPGLSR